MADKGPRQGVLPEWVPQLQLHMLCAGEAAGRQGAGAGRCRAAEWRA